MIQFSLIMATYGRKSEIAAFLESILKQTYDISLVEVIIIDQNDYISLDDLIETYSKKLNINHIKSKIKGLSYNRNVGLNIARGKYIAFPDDDCTYYPETLSATDNLFQTEIDVDIFLGKIYDKKNNKNIIRNWRDKSYIVNMYNFYTSYSSITIFTRKNNILFDEKLGVGQYFGSYEDADYVLQALNKKLKIKYQPDIVVWHPDLSANIMSYQKIFSYGLGFGALCKKYNNFPILFLFIQALMFHLLKAGIGLIKLDGYEVKKRWLSFSSRIRGYFEY